MRSIGTLLPENSKTFCRKLNRQVSAKLRNIGMVLPYFAKNLPANNLAGFGKIAEIGIMKFRQILAFYRKFRNSEYWNTFARKFRNFAEN